MIKKKINQKTKLCINNSVVGETIETKIERVITNKEPIEDTASIIYTERKNGVEPQYNIRTDRFDIAIDAMTNVARSHVAKRNDFMKKREESGNHESGQGTEH